MANRQAPNKHKGKKHMNKVTTLPAPAPKPLWSAPATSAEAKITTMFPSSQEKVVAPVVYYTDYAWAIIRHLVDSCPQEVGWLGTVQSIGNDYLIDGIYIPEQTVSGTETDIATDAMVALAIELMEDNKDPGTLFYWGHSHVNMGVSPSGQDERQVAEYLDNCPKFIRGIYNKAGASKVDVYDRDARLIYQCVKNVVQPKPVDQALLKSVDEIIAANVKKHVYTPPATGYNYGNYGYENLGKYLPPKQKHQNQSAQAALEFGFGAVQNMVNQVTRFDETLGCYYFSDGSFIGELSLDSETQKLLEAALAKKETANG